MAKWGFKMPDAQKRVEKIQRRFGNIGPALRVGAAAIDKLIDDSFHLQRGPSGKIWDPLKESTKKARGRRRRQSVFRTLQDTGVLRRSWNARPSGPRSILFGTNVPYARYHQAGTKHMEARRMAPAERIGGRWVFITRGPAKRVFDELRRNISRHIREGRVR